MAKFQDKTVGGVTYNMSHLNPMVIQVPFEAQTFETLVDFSCHCFTEKFDAHVHTEADSYLHNGEKRAFDVERHRLSLALPGQLATLGNQTIYHTQQESFFFLRTVNSLGATVPYVVFLRSFKSNKENLDVVVNVSSAYTKPGMTKRAAPVKFSRMVNARAKNLHLPLGPMRQIKRS